MANFRSISLKEWFNPWTTFNVQKRESHTDWTLKAKIENLRNNGMVKQVLKKDAMDIMLDFYPTSTFYFWAGRLNRPAKDSSKELQDHHKNHLGVFDLLTLGTARSVESFCHGHWSEDSIVQKYLPWLTGIIHAPIRIARWTFGVVMTAATYVAAAAVILAAVAAVVSVAAVVAIAAVPVLLYYAIKKKMLGQIDETTTNELAHIDAQNKPVLKDVHTAGLVVTKTRVAEDKTEYRTRELIEGKADFTKMRKVVIEGNWGTTERGLPFRPGNTYYDALNAVPENHRQVKQPKQGRDAPLRTVFFMQGKPTATDKQQAKEAAVKDQEPREYLFIRTTKNI